MCVFWYLEAVLLNDKCFQENSTTIDLYVKENNIFEMATWKSHSSDFSYKIWKKPSHTEGCTGGPNSVLDICLMFNKARYHNKYRNPKFGST